MDPDGVVIGAQGKQAAAETHRNALLSCQVAYREVARHRSVGRRLPDVDREGLQFVSAGKRSRTARRFTKYFTAGAYQRVTPSLRSRDEWIGLAHVDPHGDEGAAGR